MESGQGKRAILKIIALAIIFVFMVVQTEISWAGFQLWKNPSVKDQDSIGYSNKSSPLYSISPNYQKSNPQESKIIFWKDKDSSMDSGNISGFYSKQEKPSPQSNSPDVNNNNEGFSYQNLRSGTVKACASPKNGNNEVALTGSEENRKEGVLTDSEENKPVAMASEEGLEREICYKEINWLNKNRSEYTGLPLSFQVPLNKAQEIWPETINEHQRMILNEGLNIYDGAVAQVVWAKTGDFKKANKLTETYWRGSLEELQDLRASKAPFIYTENQEEKINPEEGKRGYIFGIINAEGKYYTKDPWTREDTHWEQWQPISGENAWGGVIGPLQTYYRKNKDDLIYDSEREVFYRDNQREPSEEAMEIKLAREITRAAIFLQAENGGIRKAPKGTYHENGPDYLYNELSTENNLSWYAGFKMLYQITGEEKYQTAMGGIEGYLKDAYNPEEGIFVHGMHYFPEQGWVKNDIFATDCQTWAILSLGPEKIDQWFGDGATFKMWEETKLRAGVFDEQDKLLGVDFTDYRALKEEYPERKPMVWIEGTAGAIMACEGAAQYYAGVDEEWADECVVSLIADKESMENYIETKAVDGYSVGYPYATGTGPSINRPTGHGWYAPPEEVLSLASTSWVALNKLDYNPFFLGGKMDSESLEP